YSQWMPAAQQAAIDVDGAGAVGGDGTAPNVGTTGGLGGPTMIGMVAGGVFVVFVFRCWNVGRGEGGRGGWRRALSPRETEVMKLLAEGSSVKDIATLLALSTKTIEAHRTNLMRKLGLHNRVQLVKYAIQEGFIKVEIVNPAQAQGAD